MPGIGWRPQKLGAVRDWKNVAAIEDEYAETLLNKFICPRCFDTHFNGDTFSNQEQHEYERRTFTPGIGEDPEMIQLRERLEAIHLGYRALVACEEHKAQLVDPAWTKTRYSAHFNKNYAHSCMFCWRKCLRGIEFTHHAMDRIIFPFDTEAQAQNKRNHLPEETFCVTCLERHSNKFKDKFKVVEQSPGTYCYVCQAYDDRQVEEEFA